MLRIENLLIVLAAAGIHKQFRRPPPRDIQSELFVNLDSQLPDIET
jgi:hypothetical protein